SRVAVGAAAPDGAVTGRSFARSHRPAWPAPGSGGGRSPISRETLAAGRGRLVYHHDSPPETHPMPSPRGVRFFLRTLQGLCLLVLVAALGPASAQNKEPERPKANYKLASKFSAANLGPMTYSTTVLPTFIGKTDVFWYSFRTSKGTKYWRVEPAKKSKAELFDHEKLSEQLAELSRKPVEATSLALTRTQVNAEGSKFT